MKSKLFFSLRLTWLSLLAVGVLSSCKQTKPTAEFEIRQRATESLMDRMEQNAFDFEWFSAKASCVATIDGKKQSFKSVIRIRKDSAISIVLSMMNIEGARALITRDSLKFINRQNSTYFLGDYKFIYDNFSVGLDFNTIQNVLLGNMAVKFLEADKPVSWIDSTLYLISNVKGRKLRKSMVKEQKMERLSRREGHILQYWIHPESFKIIRTGYSQLKDDRDMFAEYEEFEEVDGQMFPHDCIFSLRSGDKQSELKVKYSKVRINRPQKVSFKIPQKYEQIY